MTNKQPAPIQITAEQIVREAAERQETPHRPPKQDITDPIEMDDFRMRTRKQFEDVIRRNRFNINTWLKYAKFEEEQRDLARTRSVYERALDVDFRNVKVWLQYAEMEMRCKNVNHARNIWERAVTLHPRFGALKLKEITMDLLTSTNFLSLLYLSPSFSLQAEYILVPLRLHGADARELRGRAADL